MITGNQYVLFRNARQVIQADNACRRKNLPVRIVPVPEQISSECGMCLQFDRANRTEIEQLISDLHLNVIYYEL